MALHSAILPCLSTHLTPKAINQSACPPPWRHTLFLVLWEPAGGRIGGIRLGKEKKKGASPLPNAPERSNEDAALRYNEEPKGQRPTGDAKERRKT